MGPAEVAAILFGVFALLIILRVPVAFALGLACVPVFFIDDRLTPFLLLNEMLKSYNSFLLLAIPFFMLAANLMNTAGITEKLINLSRVLVGHLPGGLGHVSVLVSMLFAGISGSSTAEAAGVGGVLIPAMKKQGYDTRFTVALIACAAVMKPTPVMPPPRPATALTTSCGMWKYASSHPNAEAVPMQNNAMAAKRAES